MPLVPVIVKVDVPKGVDALVVTVSVEDPEPVTDGGLNATVVPAGLPVTLRDTLPVNPFSALTVAVYVVLPPTMTLREVGATVSEKFGGAFTVKVTIAVCDVLPLVPVIVSV